MLGAALCSILSSIVNMLHASPCISWPITHASTLPPAKPHLPQMAVNRCLARVDGMLSCGNGGQVLGCRLLLFPLLSMLMQLLLPLLRMLSRCCFHRCAAPAG